MSKSEFVEWFKTNMCWENNYSSFSDDYWREMVDYADYRFNYITINEETVEYRWEELYWGGSTWHEDVYTFDEFVEAKNNDLL